MQFLKKTGGYMRQRVSNIFRYMYIRYIYTLGLPLTWQDLTHDCWYTPSESIFIFPSGVSLVDWLSYCWGRMGTSNARQDQSPSTHVGYLLCLRSNRQSPSFSSPSSPLSMNDYGPRSRCPTSFRHSLTIPTASATTSSPRRQV